MKKIYKIIIEDTCENCPYYEEDEWDDVMKLMCNHPDNQIFIDRIESDNEIRAGFFIFDYDHPKIPKTCPLKDADE